MDNNSKTIQPKVGDTLTVNGTTFVAYTGEQTSSTGALVVGETGNGNKGLSVRNTTRTRCEILALNSAVGATNAQLIVDSGSNTPLIQPPKMSFVASTDKNLDVGFSPNRVNHTITNTNNYIAVGSELVAETIAYNYYIDGDTQVGVRMKCDANGGGFDTTTTGGGTWTDNAVFGINDILLLKNSSVYNNSNLIATFTDLGITFSQILTFDSGDGVKDNSLILTASTAGNYTMTIVANSFKTTINTPTASRTFILPTLTGGSVGYWYGICNKSTAFTIAVQYPSGTTLFTIPVATNAGGGSFAKFAVDTSSSAYFRSG